MARFLSKARISELTPSTPLRTVAAHASNHTLLMSVTAPANQKLVVRFRTWGRGISATGTHVRFTVRRAGTMGTPVALTLVKKSALDTETLQAAAAGYSVQPGTVTETGNGTVIEHFDMHPQQESASESYIVNGGETLSLWGITETNACPVDLQADIEE